MRAKNKLAESERSAFVRRIIGVPPHWMVQWGIILIFSALIALVGIAYGLKYPDVVISNIEISSENPPVSVTVANKNTIKKIFITEGDTVTIGQPIALKLNTANYDDIVFLDSLLRNIDTLNDDFVEKFKALPYLHLGEVQSAYSNTSDLIRALQKQVRIVHVQNQAKQEVADKLRDVERQTDAENKRYLNLQQKTDVVSRKFYDVQLKYINKAVALAELQKAQKEKENAENELKFQKRVLDDQMLILKKIKSDLHDPKRKNDSPPLSDKENLSLLESINRLKDALFQWKKTNLVLAPYSGKFLAQSSKTNLKENPFAADVIGLILTSSDTTLVGTVIVPNRFNRIIQPNQKVVIHLYQPYVSEEFLVEGFVEWKNISNRDKNSTIVRVKLVNSNDLKRKLIEKNIESTQNTILARSEIIGAERTLLERIFTKFL